MENAPAIPSIPTKSWSLTRRGRLRLSFDLPEASPAADACLIIAQREDGTAEWSPNAPGLQHRIPLEHSASHAYHAEVDLTQLAWHDARWDIIVLASNAMGTEQLPYELKFTIKQRKYLYLHAVQAYLPEDGIVIPYLTGRRTLALIYRERRWYDSPWYHTKELIAIAAYRFLHRQLDARRTWLVYEKECNRAQDNGFYFFKYCMEELPPEERKRILFVIDPYSPDYDRVRFYGRNVVKFMSFRYFLACLSAEMLVGSETKIHLSPQRSRPSYVKHKLVKTMTFFLQHGVMAFKRTDKRMGATGWHPVDYFLVSSKREQEVITGNFGYDDEHTPVLGQARWDALEDHSDPAAPKILLMPTWREWLADVSDEEFLETDFCRSYSALLNSPQLEKMLAAHNATLQVFLHPLFLHLQHLLVSESPHVQVLDPAARPLNEIIMGCSAMLTDYSSAVWDAVYQGKPALFYHFDRKLYLEKTGSYIDFDTELPGECFIDAGALISGLAATIERDFTPTAQQERAATHWYAHRDHNNCRRIYECALAIERTL